MKFVRFVVLLLVVVGAINWGLWGFFQYDLVQAIVGSDTSPVARTIYSIIGLAGLYSLSFFVCCGSCSCKSKEKK